MDSIKKIKLNNTTYAVGDQRIDDLNETRLGPTIEIDEFGELNQSRIGRAGTYGPESNNTLIVPKITTDEFGRVIEVSTHDIHCVQNVTTGSTNGTVNVDGTDVAVYGLGNAAYKGVATSIGASGSDSYLATEKAVRDAIDVLPEPMIFKGSLGTGGTITSLPTASASNAGFTYKVIEDGTYASQSAKIGDTFISDGSSWILIPSGDEPSGTVTSVGITQGSGISVTGGPITTSGSITVSHANTSSQPSSSNSGRTYIQSITLDDYGHVTGLATATETVTDTWRPLGTGADDACAGNDSRLSDARPASDVYSWAKASTKPSYGWLEITDRPTLAAVATSGEYEDLIGKPTLSTVASSGNYNDLSNKPTIPTVNNGTLTIQRAGTTVATFTANQSGNTTANISIDTDDLSEVRLGPTLSVDEDKELSLSKIRHAEILNLFGSTLNIDEFGRVTDNYPQTNLINSGDSILNIVNTGIYNVAATSGITGTPIPTINVGDIVVVFCGISSSVRLYLYHSLYNNNLYYGFKTPSQNYIAWGRIQITDV